LIGLASLFSFGVEHEGVATGRSWCRESRREIKSYLMPSRRGRQGAGAFPGTAVMVARAASRTTDSPVGRAIDRPDQKGDLTPVRATLGWAVARFPGIDLKNEGVPLLYFRKGN
jgi:hypothetical protein